MDAMLIWTYYGKQLIIYMGINQDRPDKNLRIINTNNHKIFSPVSIPRIFRSYAILWKQLHFENASDLQRQRFQR